MENLETIKNGESRDNGNIGHTRHMMKTNKENSNDEQHRPWVLMYS